MTCENATMDGAHPCGEPSRYRFTWPSHDKPTELCETHMRKLVKSAIPSLLNIEPIGDAPAFDAEPQSDVERDLARAHAIAAPIERAKAAGQPLRAPKAEAPKPSGEA